MTPQEKDQLCLRLYHDIINGYTVSLSGDKEIYLKHLRDVDHALFEEKRDNFKLQAIRKGLQTEEEFYSLLDKTGNWSKEEEAKYKKLNQEIQNLSFSRDKIFIEKQRNLISQRIEQKEKELLEIKATRDNLKINTVEDYAEAKTNDFILCYCLFKDKELKNPLFEFEEYQELDVSENFLYSSFYYSNLQKFSQKNIKRIAHSNFFLNSYLLCKGRPHSFMGKPVKDFTTYQGNLFAYGNGCKNILENSDNTIPDFKDIDDTVNWFSKERDIIQRKYSGKSSAPTASSGSNKERFEAISYPGSTSEEISQIAASEEAKPVNFKEAADKLKKQLGKDSLGPTDLIKLHQ